MEELYFSADYALNLNANIVGIVDAGSRLNEDFYDFIVIREAWERIG